MKRLILAALAACIAMPAGARIVPLSLSVYCSPDWGDFEEIYGPMSPVGDIVQNKDGIGVMTGESDEADAMFLILPSGTFCAFWDNKKKEGDPA